MFNVYSSFVLRALFVNRPIPRYNEKVVSVSELKAVLGTVHPFWSWRIIVTLLHCGDPISFKDERMPTYEALNPKNRPASVVPK